MLSTLLPGLRAVRSPLAAGWLILGVAVVAFTGPAKRVTTGDLGDGYKALDDLLGRAGWIVVASVGAYLLGAAYISLHERLVRHMNTKIVGAVVRSDYLDRDQKLWEKVLMPFSRPSLRRLGRTHSSERDSEEARLVCLDILFGGGVRLLLANRDSWMEYDRLRAESEFRDAVAIPLAVLVTALAIESSVDVAVGLLAVVAAGGFAVALFCAARRLEREAYSMHAHLVADGVVSTASLDNPLNSGRGRLASLEE